VKAKTKPPLALVKFLMVLRTSSLAQTFPLAMSLDLALSDFVRHRTGPHVLHTSIVTAMRQPYSTRPVRHRC
jgi:hypothetical protein